MFHVYFSGIYTGLYDHVFKSFQFSVESKAYGVCPVINMEEPDIQRQTVTGYTRYDA